MLNDDLSLVIIHTYHAEEVVYLYVACTQAGPQSLHACLIFLQSGPLRYARSFLHSRAADHVSVGSMSSCRPTVSIYFSTTDHVRHLNRYGVADHRGHRQVQC